MVVKNSFKNLATSRIITLGKSGKSPEDQFYYILLDVDIMDRKFLIAQLDV